MKPIKKRELLKAMEQILREYKNTSHTTRLTECGLCKLYYMEVVVRAEQCKLCPMSVFGRAWSQYPCKNRKCEPVDCTWEISYLGTKKLPVVIEFYEEAISVVKTMTSRQMNKKDAFKFLLNIDNWIAIKHKL